MIAKIEIESGIIHAIAPDGAPPKELPFEPASDGDGYTADGWALTVADECGYGQSLAEVWVVRPVSGLRAGDSVERRLSAI